MQTKTEMQEKPAAVSLEKLPGGRSWAMLHKNIEKVTKEPQEEGETQQTFYRADEVSFFSSEDQGLTKEDLERNFAAWWEYGAAWNGEEAQPTTEERLVAVEEFMALYLTGGLTNV